MTATTTATLAATALRRMAPALALVLALVPGQALRAQEPAAAPTLADLGRDNALAAAYAAMSEGHPMPDWIADGIVVTPAQPVAFGGKTYLAMQGCKQHDCAANQIAMLYAPEDGAAYGVLSVRDGDGAELLTWLNIGGGPESIDGRTILYAALTGSLGNHPESFRYE